MYERFGIKYILADSERLEKFELESVRILTGLTSYASLLSIYKETGWEKLSARREKRKLSLLYDIVSGQSPDYLQDLLPITVGQTNNYNLRNSRNFTIPSPGRFHNSLRKVSQFPDEGFVNCPKMFQVPLSGADPRGGAPGACPPPLKLEKNMIFWRKIVIFHTKYPKNFRASLRSAPFF